MRPWSPAGKRWRFCAAQEEYFREMLEPVDWMIMIEMISLDDPSLPKAVYDILWEGALHAQLLQ